MFLEGTEGESRLLANPPCKARALAQREKAGAGAGDIALIE